MLDACTHIKSPPPLCLQEMQDALTSSEEEKNALKRQLAKLSKKYQQVGGKEAPPPPLPLHKGGCSVESLSGAFSRLPNHMACLARPHPSAGRAAGGAHGGHRGGRGGDAAHLDQQRGQPGAVDHERRAGRGRRAGGEEMCWCAGLDCDGPKEDHLTAAPLWLCEPARRMHQMLHAPSMPRVDGVPLPPLRLVCALPMPC